MILISNISKRVERKLEYQGKKYDSDNDMIALTFFISECFKLVEILETSFSIIWNNVCEQLSVILNLHYFFCLKFDKL